MNFSQFVFSATLIILAASKPVSAQSPASVRATVEAAKGSFSYAKGQRNEVLVLPNTTFTEWSSGPDNRGLWDVYLSVRVRNITPKYKRKIVVDVVVRDSQGIRLGSGRLEALTVEPYDSVAVSGPVALHDSRIREASPPWKLQYDVMSEDMDHSPTASQGGTPGWVTFSLAGTTLQKSAIRKTDDMIVTTVKHDKRRNYYLAQADGFRTRMLVLSPTREWETLASTRAAIAPTKSASFPSLATGNGIKIGDTYDSVLKRLGSTPWHPEAWLSTDQSLGYAFNGGSLGWSYSAEYFFKKDRLKIIVLSYYVGPNVPG